MSAAFLHLRTLLAAISIITTRTQLQPCKENAGVTPTNLVAELALEELDSVGMFMNCNLPQIQLVPPVEFQTIKGTAVPPPVDWDCAQTKPAQLLHLLDSVAPIISLGLVSNMDLLVSCLNSL